MMAQLVRLVILVVAGMLAFGSYRYVSPPPLSLALTLLFLLLGLVGSQFWYRQRTEQPSNLSDRFRDPPL